MLVPDPSLLSGCMNKTKESNWLFMYFLANPKFKECYVPEKIKVFIDEGLKDGGNLTELMGTFWKPKDSTKRPFVFIVKIVFGAWADKVSNVFDVN